MSTAAANATGGSWCGSSYLCAVDEAYLLNIFKELWRALSARLTCTDFASIFMGRHVFLTLILLHVQMRQCNLQCN